MYYLPLSPHSPQAIQRLVSTTVSLSLNILFIITHLVYHYTFCFLLSSPRLAEDVLTRVEHHQSKLFQELSVVEGSLRSELKHSADALVAFLIIHFVYHYTFCLSLYILSGPNSSTAPMPLWRFRMVCVGRWTSANNSWSKNSDGRRKRSPPPRPRRRRRQRRLTRYADVFLLLLFYFYFLINAAVSCLWFVLVIRLLLLLVITVVIVGSNSF
jgi:hypothetical protein